MSTTTTNTTMAQVETPCCTTPCTHLCTLNHSILELEGEVATEACDMLDDSCSDLLKHLYTTRDHSLAKLTAQALDASTPAIKELYLEYVERCYRGPWKAQRQASQESVQKADAEEVKAGRARADSGVECE